MWDSGQKWLSSFFENHQAEAQQVAEANAGEFLNDLAVRLERLENENPYNKEFFSNAFKEPSFSVLLQKAIINSAQTKDKGKHSLLSKLVAEKLKSKNESTVSLASQMACDAIAFATERQLKILGLISALIARIPRFVKIDKMTEITFYADCESYANRTLIPLLIPQIGYFDLLHLEALSCAKINALSRFCSQLIRRV